ncbi:TetR family transcriptional regulator [Mangrovactinospora gilvigrisea]|uniref:TetR family transcriptional regulator n=1 Tax=Mangrovactinospora gilvigrisea TaxID=1428644 RepID=A0A1J7BI27_9ACTN|nr:TetR family transcriptional regulator [Mangrovactinospora gilvigrisea]OIV38237.1 TetR family transcriptional regulator [Mangrovactinospora gilvigrisea]
MGRWQPNARGRLEQAALELYREQGFERTTVKEIAARAGLTERTFFRYFADKREVLFPDANPLQELILAALAEVPADVAPIDAVSRALQATAERAFEGRRGFARQRQSVIAAHEGLRERELVKLASITEALAEAFRGRGVAEPRASLAAEAGSAVFGVAFRRWISGPEDPADAPDLAREIRECFAELKAAAAEGDTISR